MNTGGIQSLLDDVDVIVTSTSDELHYCRLVYDWCFENEITALFVLSWMDDGVMKSGWRVQNEKERTMFILKWGR